MATKERIDIEELLRWAYQRQRVDRVAAVRDAAFNQAGGSSSAPWVKAGERLLKLGTRIDNSTPPTMFDPKAPEDAEIIHDTVLKLDEMFIDDEGGVWTRERIEGAGASLVQDKAKRFWMEIAGAVAPLTPTRIGALLIIHAKNGSRPEWCEGWSAAGARDAGAADRGARDDWGRKRRSAREYTAEDVAFYRAEYQCWHAALAVLAVQLATCLRDFEPVQPSAPAAPWGGKKNAAFDCNGKDREYRSEINSIEAI